MAQVLNRDLSHAEEGAAASELMGIATSSTLVTRLTRLLEDSCSSHESPGGWGLMCQHCWGMRVPIHAVMEGEMEGLGVSWLHCITNASQNQAVYISSACLYIKYPYDWSSE